MNAASLSRLVSDLVVGVFAFCTENEEGALLAQRVQELKTTLKNIHNHIEHITKVRTANSSSIVSTNEIGYCSRYCSFCGCILTEEEIEREVCHFCGDGF